MDEATGFDPGDPGFVRDPYPVFDRLRGQGRALWHEPMGMYLAFRHADADAVLRSRRLGRLFTPREPTDVWGTFNWLHADSILDSEPPKHTRLRALVAKAFARGHVERLRPRVRQLANALLDEVEGNGRLDVVTDYAEPLPVMVIAELLGIPEHEQAPLRPWSQDIVKMYELDRTPEQEARARQSSEEFAEYVAVLAKRRRASPGDDLVTHLVQVEEAGEKLDEHELIATCVLLLNAGHEASVNGFGNGVVALFRNPDQLDWLRRDPGGIAETAVEEFLRYDAPLQLFERTATEDVEVAGVTLRRGEKIAALLGSANRDPEVFQAPGRMDVTRAPNRHLAFGAGIHHCLGAPLARLEMQISLPVLLERLPGAAPGRRTGSAVDVRAARLRAGAGHVVIGPDESVGLHPLLERCVPVVQQVAAEAEQIDVDGVTREHVDALAQAGWLGRGPLTSWAEGAPRPPSCASWSSCSPALRGRCGSWRRSTGLRPRRPSGPRTTCCASGGRGRWHRDVRWAPSRSPTSAGQVRRRPRHS